MAKENKIDDKEIGRILKQLSECLPDNDKLLLERHFRYQLKQSFVHGIMAGPDGNFDKYYKQKYDFFKKEDDHIGI